MTLDTEQKKKVPSLKRVAIGVTQLIATFYFLYVMWPIAKITEVEFLSIFPVPTMLIVAIIIINVFKVEQ